MIAGVVRDTSGAVLPGVTVEAASDVLIEKARTAVTDNTGRYQIVDLRAGRYVVSFTLPGFSTVKREGVELTGLATAAVNAELRVGAIEETVTVTGGRRWTCKARGRRRSRAKCSPRCPPREATAA